MNGESGSQEISSEHDQPVYDKTHLFVHLGGYCLLIEGGCGGAGCEVCFRQNTVESVRVKCLPEGLTVEDEFAILVFGKRFKPLFLRHQQCDVRFSEIVGQLGVFEKFQEALMSLVFEGLS